MRHHPSHGALDGDNVYNRDFLPCLEPAGLRRVTFHALRHTSASLLLLGGAILTYVKDQMGHGSIQVTVGTYGHLIPDGNIDWVDRLDSPTSPQQSATQAQPMESVGSEGDPDGLQYSEMIRISKWAHQDSNLGPTDYESAALTN